MPVIVGLSRLNKGRNNLSDKAFGIAGGTGGIIDIRSVTQKLKRYGGAMTEDEWKRVDEALSGFLSTVELIVDGTPIQFQWSFIAKNKLGIVTFINGELEGKWCLPDEDNDNPEKKYLRPVKRFKWTKKSRVAMKKMGKRHLKRMGYDPNEKYLTYSLVWSSAETIRRHYEKTFKDIKLVKINGKAVA